MLLLPAGLFASDAMQYHNASLANGGRVIISNYYNHALDHKIESVAFQVDNDIKKFSSSFGRSLDLFNDEPTKKWEDLFDDKNESLIRRAEIIFFGSLTFVSFFGWLAISGYNALMGSETFGTLKRYQFMTLFIGSGVVGLSVSISDLFMKLKPYMKNVEFD